MFWMRTISSLVFGGVCLLMMGCERYHAKPFLPQEVVDAVQRERLELAPLDPAASSTQVAAAPAPFTFTRAAELMAGHSPALKEARAEYQTALARARVKTPLSNPVLEIGPNYGFGPDMDKLYRLQPFGSIGFTIPTGGKRKRQDEFNRVTAELMFIELQAKHRELYLGLRRLYAQWTLGRAKVEAKKKIEESAEKSVAAGKKLIEAGFATALDLGLLDLEAARIKTETLNAQHDQAIVEGELSETIGIHADQFKAPPDPALPELPVADLALKELREILVNNHPELARLRARYVAAEAWLHLEIARQYPDFHFGPSYERESGEKKSILGLSLGIELPLFDRNQQGIAEAKARREELRVKYEAAANRALAALDRAWRNIQLASEKLKLIRTVLKPKAEANIALARKSIEAGATDTLRFLETERGQRAVMIDAIESEFAAREGWVELEQAVGLPLFQFPGESREAIPPLQKDQEKDKKAEEPAEKESAAQDRQGAIP